MLKNIQSYFVGVVSELKKTSWPSRQTLINYTIIVLLSSAISIAILTVIDLGLSKGIEALINIQG